MGVDQLVTGGDFDDPVVDSLTSDSVNTDDLQHNAQQPQDVESSRSEDTWETNDSPYPLLVIVVVTTGGGQAATAHIVLDVSPSQTANVIAESKSQAADSTNGERIKQQAQVIVPPGHQYRARVISGAVERWHEQKLGTDAE